MKVLFKKSDGSILDWIENGTVTPGELRGVVELDYSGDKTETNISELEAQISADNQVAALSQTIFSKLQIRRAMRELGNEAALDALLSASETFAKDWSDAVEIDLSDATTQQAIEAMTVDVDAIKLKIAGIE